MTEDTESNEHLEQVIEEAQQEVEQQQEADVQEHEAESLEAEREEEKQVPLTALQKERKKRQELEERFRQLEIQNEIIRSQAQKQPEPEEDESQYESATRAELRQSVDKTREEILRDVEERIWVKSNPEKAALVDSELQEFLKQKPNLVSAVSNSTNRYEEAYTLMTALRPRPQQEERRVIRKEAPASPSAVPKSASVNKALDVMKMSDQEYRDWRNSMRKSR